MKISAAILAKLQPHPPRQWCGYLGSVEIVALVDGGAVADAREVAQARERKAKGLASPRWFYFTPSPEQLKQLRKERP